MLTKNVELSWQMSLPGCVLFVDCSALRMARPRQRSRAGLVQDLLRPWHCRYAADQLMWLITTSVQAASPTVLAALQDRLTQCEQKGGTNASVPKDENLLDFPAIVSIAKSGVDVEDCLRGIL